MLVVVRAFAGRRMREIAIELLLLLRREYRANLIVGLIDELIMLAAEVIMQLIHLRVRIAHQHFDLM
jgi:hypothetical protein